MRLLWETGTSDLPLGMVGWGSSISYGKLAPVTCPRAWWAGAELMFTHPRSPPLPGDPGKRLSCTAAIASEEISKVI